MKSRRHVAFSLILAAALSCSTASAADELVTVRESFDADPGWIGVSNRQVGTDMPIVRQQFGWSATKHASTRAGEIGGVVTDSRHQAYYAMPFGKPLTLDDRLSASGKLSLKRLDLRGVAYLGFFNSQRHEWRPWNSMAFRIWEENSLGQIMFDWMSSDWQAAGFETDVLLKPDGQVHDWRFEYDPDAKPDPSKRDPLLEQVLTDRSGNAPSDLPLQDEPEVFKKAKAIVPDLTAEAFRSRLIKAREDGLVGFFHRHGQRRWWKINNPEQSHGRILIQIDKLDPHITFLSPEQRKMKFSMDRFGLFNIQRYGGSCEVYYGDLVVNGRKIDLSQNPHWEGRNNQVTYTEPDFHSLFNFGYSQTNHAGKGIGEIGGLFWRVRPTGPAGYYADDIGKVTLDDPISFSGSISFTTGQTDAAMLFGYFNHDEQTATYTTNVDSPVGQMLGIGVSDSSAVGYYFSGFARAKGTAGAGATGPVFTPTGQRRQFTFAYDPKAGNGAGRVTFTLDGKETSFDLTPQMRADGATFNRFGMFNMRRGGNSVTVYLDDLSYTARRDPSAKRVFHQQQVIQSPYPKRSGGRQH
jgi:hypothetical protein